MVVYLDLFHLLQSPLDQSLPIQILFRIQQLAQGGLGLGMLGGKDRAAVLVRQNGGLHGADLTGNGNDFLLVEADERAQHGHIRHRLGDCHGTHRLAGNLTNTFTSNQCRCADLLGDFCGNGFALMNRLEYDEEEKYYFVSVPLKMGVYNYQYVWVPSKSGVADNVPAEGNFYNTENEYAIYVFYRGFGDRYDRLLGVQRVNYNLGRD